MKKYAHSQKMVVKFEKKMVNNNFAPKFEDLSSTKNIFRKKYLDKASFLKRIDIDTYLYLNKLGYRIPTYNHFTVYAYSRSRLFV
jgi:hypothetical protein